jgi:double-strand break repair protein MRE11
VTINEPERLADLAQQISVEGATAQMEKITVSALVHDYLEAQNLNVLSESLIQNAVEEFVGKGDKDAVGKSVLISLSLSFEPHRVPELLIHWQ